MRLAVWRRQKKMTTSCSMCEPIRTAQSFGDDTHTMTTGLHLGMRTRTSQRCVVRLCRWVESLAHRWCSSKDAGNVERETPNPCGKRNRRSPKEQHTSCPQSTRTQNRQPRSHTHAVELATLKRSLLNAVSHRLFPTSLFLSVFLHVFALSSS